MAFLYNFIIDLKSFIKRNFSTFIGVNLLLIIFAIWGFISASNSNIQDLYDNSNSLVFGYLRGEGSGFVAFLCVSEILLLACLILLSFNAFCQRCSILFIGLKVAYIVRICCYVIAISGFFSIILLFAFLLLQLINCFIHQCVYIFIKNNELYLIDLVCYKDKTFYFIIMAIFMVLISLISCFFISFLN